MLIEVNSVEKNCPVIINLDHVLEIAPLAAGGCMVKMVYDGGKNPRDFRVSNEYKEFKQFVLETVTTSQVSNKVKELEKLQKQLGPKEKIALKTGDDIPKFGS